MSLRKQAVLVDREDGVLHRLAPLLVDLGFGITFVTRVDLAVDLVCALPRLSFLAVVEDVAGASADRFLATVKRLHRELPVMWVGAPGVARTQFTEFVPDLYLTTPIDEAGLVDHLHRLLREHYYPPVIVAALRTGACEILRTGFATNAEPGEIFLRANRSMLADVSAVISFCGSGVAGYVVVSGEADHFAAIHRRAAPQSGAVASERAVDVAGELANQIMGRLARYLRRVVSSFAQGLPIVIQGSRTILHRFQARPSIVLPLTDGEHGMFVEFCFETFDPGTDVVDPGPDEEALPEGSMSFFEP
jgi:CheY-specific phosphatase CheX